jgi:tetratricopeptide (TPR) repeat protein
LQALLEYVENLQDGFGKCVGLMYKSLRCSKFRQRTDLLVQAKSQTEQLSTHCRPKLLHSLFVNLGHLLNNVGRHQDSLDCCDQALKLWQGNARAFLWQGNALHNLRRYEEALESSQKALDLNPKFANAFLWQGNALHNLRRYEEALESFQKVLEFDSKASNAWAYRGIALNNRPVGI